ncbi:MAG: type I restriction enzyme HsdR N-terminal domain-containing protein [Bacteroidales bacterium]|nr:type I restriction enzyme HsdR N-terminal domain-containing protein [Bacteroidales bacterium]
MLRLNLPSKEFKIRESDGKLAIFDEIRKKYVALTPEEWVRQHFIYFLISDKNYPKSLIANEISIKLNNTSKRCDSVIYDRNFNPLVIVEYKAPEIEITQAVFDQISRYNIVFKVPYLIVSNGLVHYCCHIDYTLNKTTFLSEIPLYESII